MSSVILKNVVKRFGSVTAVDNLSIEIQDKNSPFWLAHLIEKQRLCA